MSEAQSHLDKENMNKQTARQLFIEWQESGKEPKAKYIAVKAVSKFTGIPEATFNTVCPNKSERKIDDGLAFLYWDITENGGRAIGYDYQESNRARLIYLLSIARGIVVGKRVDIKLIKLPDGSHPTTTESISVAYHGYKAVAKMSPYQLAGESKKRLKKLLKTLETWRAINSYPEIVIEAVQTLRDVADKWEAQVHATV